MNVLVVVTDEDTEDLICRRLRAEIPGVAISLQRDGKEAIAYAEEHTLDGAIVVRGLDRNGESLAIDLTTKRPGLPILLLDEAHEASSTKSVRRLHADRLLDVASELMTIIQKRQA